ncbi:MAG: hypothetical protein KDI82_03535 [Gammaproteobacteria bacterium]|nr:hypothetical protein [Gammaproteobacteria bacterium]
MSDAIEVNVTGRLMLLLTRQHLLDNRSLSLYQCAVSEAVRRRLADVGAQGMSADFERLLDEQLALLERALGARAANNADETAHVVFADELGRQGLPEAAVASDDAAVANPESGASEEVQRVEENEATLTRRAPRAPSGYVPTVKSMEEKLQDERKPIQSLLREDCVRVGLIDGNVAKRLIQGMTGKTSQQAEQDIVEHLRQTLQDQVKTFIRKAKGGPWADPRTQEDLRKDIHAARSVRSILMLARQVVKEYQLWQRENHRGGILGLFSPRKRIVQR